mgnify:CR=1 FL=1
MEDATPDPVQDTLDVFKVLLIRLKTPVNLLALVGLIWACRRRDFERGSLVLITLCLYVGAMAALTWKTLNYVMQLLPLAHVLAGVAAVDISRRLGRRNVAAGVAARTALASVVVVHALLAVPIHPHYLLDGNTWEKYLNFEGQLGATAYHTQPLRPGIEWLARNAGPGSHVAVLFPAVFAPKIQRRVLYDAMEVIRFEVRRMPLAQAKQIAFETTVDPDRMVKSEYAFLLCCHPGWLGPYLSGYRQVHEVRLNGKTYAWIFHRPTG